MPATRRLGPQKRDFAWCKPGGGERCISFWEFVPLDWMDAAVDHSCDSRVFFD